MAINLAAPGRFPRAACALALTLGVCAPAWAERTDIDVRVLARGAKFIGGYTASASVTLTDADTGEVLARGLTQGTTGDTERSGSSRAAWPATATAPAAIRRCSKRRWT